MCPYTRKKSSMIERRQTCKYSFFSILQLSKDKTIDMTMEIFSTPDPEITCEGKSKYSAVPEVPEGHQPHCHLYRTTERIDDHIKL